MSERAYPLTEEEQLKQRILTPQPTRRVYSPPIHLFDPPPAPTPTPAEPAGCVFAKPCQLPDGITHYTDPTGFVPLELVKEYGHFCLLGGREVDDHGVVSLRKISGSALPIGLGQLALRTAVVESAAAAAVGTVAGGLLTGLVALAWPSELGDSALYTDEQLRSMQRARSQMRLQSGTRKRVSWKSIETVIWNTSVHLILLPPSAEDRRAQNVEFTDREEAKKWL